MSLSETSVEPVL